MVKVVVDGGLREVAISHGHQLADAIYLASNLSFLVLVCGADPSLGQSAVRDDLCALHKLGRQAALWMDRMLRPKRNDKPVLLNLPKRVLEEVDMAVREQGVTRSHFLRQAIERNLRQPAGVHAPSVVTARIEQRQDLVG